MKKFIAYVGDTKYFLEILREDCDKLVKYKSLFKAHSIAAWVPTSVYLVVLSFKIIITIR